MFIMIENNYKLSEEFIYVLFSVEVLPIFQTKSWELLEHLTFLKEIHLLSFLTISFWVKSRQLKKQILTDLHQRQCHINFATESRMHSEEWSPVEFLKSWN